VRFLVLVLSIWNTATGFGKLALDLFISLHPTVFERTQAFGFIMVNTLYALVDGFLLGLALSFLYNLFIRKERAAGE
ncbi:MAG TPA: hypothetical protein PK297_02525, partial [Spirochaetota bacterium]|nr:hypothetical protein [Spirochaetota bacterium]